MELLLLVNVVVAGVDVGIFSPIFVSTTVAAVAGNCCCCCW